MRRKWCGYGRGSGGGKGDKPSTFFFWGLIEGVFHRAHPPWVKSGHLDKQFSLFYKIFTKFPKFFNLSCEKRGETAWECLEGVFSDWNLTVRFTFQGVVSSWNITVCFTGLRECSLIGTWWWGLQVLGSVLQWEHDVRFIGLRECSLMGIWGEVFRFEGVFSSFIETRWRGLQGVF